MSIPRHPNSIELRKEIASSDSSDYTTIDKNKGVPGGNHRFGMVKVKIEGTTPDITIKTLVWDDDYGWLELLEGGFSNATESFSAPVEILGQRVFPHITVNAGTNIKVSVKMSGWDFRAEMA